MTVIGDAIFIQGFEDGYKGNEVRMPGNQEYENAYGRGYETAERQSANQEYTEKQLTQRYRSEKNG